VAIVNSLVGKVFETVHTGNPGLADDVYMILIHVAVVVLSTRKKHGAIIALFSFQG
jgi:hypothetical protein